MRTLVKLLATVAIATSATVPLSGCSTLGTVTQAANTSVSKDELNKRAFQVRAAYLTALYVATPYVELPRCTPAPSPPVCSSATIVAEMKKASDVADRATKDMASVVRAFDSNPKLLQVVVAGAEAAVKAFADIADAYSYSPSKKVTS